MKENNLFKLVHINELGSIFNREIAIDKEMAKNCQLAFLNVLQYKKGVNTVGLHVSIRFLTSSGAVLMQEGATFVAEIDGWKDMSHVAEQLKKDHRIRALVEYGLAFVSGMIYSKISGTVLNNIFVPYMSIDYASKELVIEEIKA